MRYKRYNGICFHETSVKNSISILNDNKIKCKFDIFGNSRKYASKHYPYYVYCCAFLDVTDKEFYGIGKNEIMFVIDCDKLTDRKPLIDTYAENGVVQIRKGIYLNEIIHIFIRDTNNINTNKLNELRINYTIGNENSRNDIIEYFKYDYSRGL